MNTEKNPTPSKIVDVFGPTLEFLTAPQEAHIGFCVLKGVIPPGVSIPLHSHPDTEDFIILSGHVQSLQQVPEGYTWLEGQEGDYFHVPSGAKHAWRNVSDEPLVALSITTLRLARFFEEIGRPVTDTPQPVTPEDLEHFAMVSARYGYWNATPEENAAVGIQLF